MSNINRKTYVISDAAVEVMDQIHSSFRAKFVSDAIVEYSKRRGVLDTFIVSSKLKPNKKENLIIDENNEIEVDKTNLFKGGSDHRF